MVEGHGGDAVIEPADLVERLAQHLGREDIGVAQVDHHLLLRHAKGLFAHRVGQQRHVGVGALRQDEAEAIFLRARKACGQPVRLIVEEPDGFLDAFDRLGPDSGAAIEHAINRCHADARRIRHVFDGCPCHGVITVSFRLDVNS